MKKLKALLINGSPRAKGCTYTALTELKNTLEQEGIDKGVRYYTSTPEMLKKYVEMIPPVDEQK